MNNIPHDWINSTLGHGEQMCSRCFITNREAAVLNLLNTCRVPPKEEKPASTLDPELLREIDSYGYY